MATQDRLPTGTGTTSQWTSSTASPNKWEDVDDPIGTPDDATSYLFVTNAASGTELFTFAQFAITSSAIALVRLTWRGTRTVGLTTVTPIIRTGTTNRNGTSQAMTAAYVDYTNDWLTNPATASAWEENEVEQTDGTTTHRLNEFGWSSSPSSGRETHITQSYLTVDYTDAGSGGVSIPVLTQHYRDMGIM